MPHYDKHQKEMGKAFAFLNFAMLSCNIENGIRVLLPLSFAMMSYKNREWCHGVTFSMEKRPVENEYVGSRGAKFYPSTSVSLLVITASKNFT